MLIYMAHPVRPIEGETLAGNIERAEAWLRWCHDRFQAWTVIAPWLAELHAYGLDEEGERAQRAEGIARQLDVVRRCDGVLLVGSRISDGMKMEARSALREGRQVFSVVWSDLESPPDDLSNVDAYELSVDLGDWPEALQ